MFQTLTSTLAAIVAICVCGFAMYRGAVPTRIAGGVFLSAWLVTPLIRIADPSQVEWFVFAIDVVVLSVFLALTLKFRRFWLVGASAFQLLAASTHLAMLVDFRVTLNSYVMALGLWSLAVLGSILAGAFSRQAAQEREASGRPV